MQDASNKTRYSLILRLGQPADAEAWQEFCEIYQPLIFRIARSRGLQDADAHDLTQEVMTRVAKSVGKWRPLEDKGSFRSWIGTIARNLLIDFIRKRSTASQHVRHTDIQQLLNEIPGEGSLGDHGMASKCFDAEFEKQIFIWAAAKIKSSFQPKTWKAFWATAVNARPVVDVAEELQISAGAIYVARSRVIARLKKTIDAAKANDSYLIPKTAPGRSKGK